jgi:Arc/MetJ-type ribon-helix-helix transcriptional regulator
MALKERTVLSAEKRQILMVREIVRTGRYRSVSHFVRAAIDEKLERDEQARLEQELERYVASGHHREDADLIAAQAWPEGKRKRAKR